MNEIFNIILAKNYKPEEYASIFQTKLKNTKQINSYIDDYYNEKINSTIQSLSYSLSSTQLERKNTPSQHF